MRKVSMVFYGVFERAGRYLINDKDEKQFNQIARN